MLCWTGGHDIRMVASSRSERAGDRTLFVIRAWRSCGIPLGTRRRTPPEVLIDTIVILDNHKDGLRLTTSVSQANDLTDIKAIWFQESPNSLVCCDCRGPFDGAALIRTFRFGPPRAHPGCARAISVGGGTQLFLFDRHLPCLNSNTHGYVAVSHVWDPAISQLEKRKNLSLATDLTRKIVDLALKIFNAVQDDNSEYEIWYDYISVPQWVDSLRSRILLAIPRIYGSASFTAVHLNDLRPLTIQLLYEGRSTEERLAGMTGICNAVWFRRVWTASEFVLSTRVRIIDRNHRLLQDGDCPLFKHMMDVWKDERSRHSVHVLEKMALHPRNLVPWNVSALFDMSQIHVAAFAHAFAMLSSRGCTKDIDFMCALNGIVKSQSDPTQHADPADACISIAQSCLRNGDYSPLIMTPMFISSAHDPRDDEGNARAWFLNDVFTWGMGPEMSPPTHASDFYFDNADPVLRLAEIGTVTMLHRATGDKDKAFTQAATFVLELTGPDVDNFVTTLGTRLYHEDARTIHNYISNRKNRQRLEDLLCLRHQQHRGEYWHWSGEHGARALRDYLGLADRQGGSRSQTPLEFLHAHGSTINLYSRNHLIRVRCNECHGESAFRAALFRAAEYVQGATAYRVPGLRYRDTRKDGVALLVKEDDRTIIGRMIWAIPACECVILRSVKLKMPRLPKPRPFTFSH